MRDPADNLAGIPSCRQYSLETGKHRKEVLQCFQAPDHIWMVFLPGKVDTGTGLTVFLEEEPGLCEDTSQGHPPTQPRLIRSQQAVMGLTLLSTLAKEHQTEALNLGIGQLYP